MLACSGNFVSDWLLSLRPRLTCRWEDERRDIFFHSQIFFVPFKQSRRVIGVLERGAWEAGWDEIQRHFISSEGKWSTEVAPLYLCCKYFIWLHKQSLSPSRWMMLLSISRNFMMKPNTPKQTKTSLFLPSL